MKSVNRVTILGNLAANVVFKKTPRGTSLACFPVATNRYVMDENQQKKEIADFHSVVAWGRLAEICNDLLASGAAIYLEGRLANRTYEKEGAKHYRTEIVATDLKILTWKKDSMNIKSVSTDEEVEELDLCKADKVAA